MPDIELSDVTTCAGDHFDRLTVAYQTYGRLSPGRDNAVLVTHGLTSSHWAAENPTLDSRIGWGVGQIGPGLVYDTDRYFVLSTNVVGSAYGSTSAASIDGATGRPWGRDFPLITMEDVVRIQAQVLDQLGIDRLKAVVGCSMGGFQAYQWAVTFPDRMERLIATDTADHDSFDLGGAIPGLLKRFENNARWNDGAPPTGALEEELTDLRIDMLEGFGLREKLAARGLAGTAIDQAIADVARDWARLMDPWVLVSLYRTAASFDVRDQLHRIAAPMLLVMADTDQWYPPTVGRAQEARLRAAGVDVRYLEIQSDLGHYATTEEPEKWTPAAARFLEG